jgi:hypothetical protein
MGYRPSPRRCRTNDKVPFLFTAITDPEFESSGPRLHFEKNQKIKEKQPNPSRDNAKLTGKKEHRVDSENKRKTA